MYQAYPRASWACSIYEAALHGGATHVLVYRADGVSGYIVGYIVVVEEGSEHASTILVGGGTRRKPTRPHVRDFRILRLCVHNDERHRS